MSLQLLCKSKITPKQKSLKKNKSLSAASHCYWDQIHFFDGPRRGLLSLIGHPRPCSHTLATVAGYFRWAGLFLPQGLCSCWPPAWNTRSPVHLPGLLPPFLPQSAQKARPQGNFPDRRGQSGLSPGTPSGCSVSLMSKCHLKLSSFLVIFS